MTGHFARRRIRLLISFALLVALYLTGGFDALGDVWGRIHWGLLAAFLVLTLATVGLFGWRWQILLDRRLALPQALRVTAIGLGANMVLPARGGDLIRVYQSHTLGSIGGHLVLARLFVEKVLDLVIIAVAGACALLPLGQYAVAEVILGPLLLLTLLVAITFRTGLHGPAKQLVRRAFAAVRLGHLYENHLARFLREFRDAFADGRSGPLLGLTCLLWVALYPALYWTGAAMVGVPLDYASALVLLLAGALSMAIPAAPSGLGTFHAAVAGGFLLLGRPLSEGVLFATVVHAATVVGLLAPALIAYVVSGPGRLVPHPESSHTR